jgi:Flp pilus assembly protein TadB
MNSKDEEMRRREQEIQERERSLRLRELEAEISQPPLIPTVKHQESKGSMNQRMKRAIEIGKFLGLIIGVVVAVKVGVLLAQVVLIAAVAFVGYKLFLSGDRKGKS